jgi:hypothetical protein
MRVTTELRWIVQLADEWSFDFGGERHGAVAAFAAKGDATLFANELLQRSGRKARVLDKRSKDPAANVVYTAWPPDDIPF